MPSLRELLGYNEYLRIYMKWRYRERRRIAIALLGGKCVECGSKEDLEIDHIDPAERGLTNDRMTKVSAERFVAELTKCQLLCKEHHKAKSGMEHRYVAHHETTNAHLAKKCSCFH